MWNKSYMNCGNEMKMKRRSSFSKPNGLYPFRDALQVSTLLWVVTSVCTPLPTYKQQLSTLLAQQCWELLRPFARSLTADFKSVLVLEVFVPLKGTPAWRLQQSFINLGTTFFWISHIWNIAQTWFLARVFEYLSSFISQDFLCWIVCIFILDVVTVKTENKIKAKVKVTA